MLYIAKRLQQRPGRLQVAVEMVLQPHQRDGEGEPGRQHERKYFPLIATLFVFILVSNLIGYIPLPVELDREVQAVRRAHPVVPDLRGRHERRLPADPRARRVRPLHLRGRQAPRPDRLPQEPDARRRQGPIVPLIFGIEILSNFLRLISLTVRLWANLLAGHMLIAFMGGELGVLVGDLPWVQWLLLPFGIAIFLFEAVLIAGLQAFIFAILTAIYLGSAVSSH
jgi:F-type H+-transporting ATPase subunit a